MPTANAGKPVDVDGHTVNKNSPQTPQDAEKRPGAWDTQQMTVYLAILKTDAFTLELEYIPLEDGALEIVSAHILPRPRSLFEVRRNGRRRGLILDDADQRAEAMQPYTRLEARQLVFFDHRKF